MLVISDSCTRLGQARAKLSVKAGGFSIGAFAASNRGKLEEFYEVEKEVAGRQWRFATTPDMFTVRVAICLTQRFGSSDSSAGTLIDKGSTAAMESLLEDWGQHANPGQRRNLLSGSSWNS